MPILINGKPSGAAGGIIRSFFAPDNRTFWNTTSTQVGHFSDRISSSQEKASKDQDIGYAPIYLHGQHHLSPNGKNTLQDYEKTANCHKKILRRLIKGRTPHVMEESHIGDPKKTSGSIFAKTIRSIRRIQSPWLHDSQKISLHDPKIELRQLVNLTYEGAVQTYLRLSEISVTLHSSGNLDADKKSIALIKTRSSLFEKYEQECREVEEQRKALDEKYPEISLEKFREHNAIHKKGIAIRDQYRRDSEKNEKAYQESLKQREEYLVENLVRVRKAYPHERIDAEYGDKHGSNIQKIFQERYPEMPLIYISLEDE